MDELNRKQLILLNMLVSFVVSIATGIITVAMLERPADEIPQTINRVIERTLERVITGTSSPITEVVPPVVEKQEQKLELSEIARLSAGKTVSLYSGNYRLSTGFLIAKDLAVFVKTSELLAATDTVFFVASQTKHYPASLLPTKNDAPYIFAKLATTKGDKLNPLPIRDTELVRGEVLYFMQGADNVLLNDSFVAEILPFSSSSTSYVSYVLPEAVPSGAVALDVHGSAVGITVQKASKTEVISTPEILANFKN